MIGSDFLSSFTHIGIRWTQFVAATAFSLTGFVLRMALQTACRPHHGWHSGAMWCWEKFGRLNPLTNGAWKTVLMWKPWGNAIINLPRVKFTTHLYPFMAILGTVYFFGFTTEYHSTYSMKLSHRGVPNANSIGQKSLNVSPLLKLQQTCGLTLCEVRREWFQKILCEGTTCWDWSSKLPLHNYHLAECLPCQAGKVWRWINFGFSICTISYMIFLAPARVPLRPSGPDRIQLTGRSHLFRLRVQGGILMGEAKPPASHHLGFWFWPPPKATGNPLSTVACWIEDL